MQPMSQNSHRELESNERLPQVWWNFRSKLVLVFLLLSLLPLIIVGYLAVDHAKQALNENAVRHLMIVSILKEEKFAEWINDNKQKLHELADHTSVREYIVTLTTSPSNTVAYQYI